MRVCTDSTPEDPAADMALTQTLLREVAAGSAEPVARVYRPGPTAAFGRLDTLRAGYPAAREAAARHGLTPLVRLGGGTAAIYGPGSVVVDLVSRSERVAEKIEERFVAGVGLLVGALAGLGVETVVGELPGAYCPGRFSLHLPGGPKIAGSAQRSIRGAALFTAVVLVEDGAWVRAALTDVYAALERPWDPATAGAIAELHPGVDADAVAAALVTALQD